MTEKPYICRTCRAQWSTPFTRCIGTDGSHRPVFPIRNRRWPLWRSA